MRTKRGLSSLQVVIMSATIEAKIFSDYFSSDEPVNVIEGRTYPIEVSISLLIMRDSLVLDILCRQY